MSYSVDFLIQFLLTRLLRGVTLYYSGTRHDGKISTHTPLARRDLAMSLNPPILIISTHTPLARRDPFQTLRCYSLPYFYSHASCEA